MRLIIPILLILRSKLHLIFLTYMHSSLLLKNVIIVSPYSDLNGQMADILIEEGKIVRIGEGVKAPEGARLFEEVGACVSIGWMDVGGQFCDPGFEHREDLGSAAQAAMAGGFTAVAPYPNTEPATDSKTGVLYIRNRTRNSLVDFYPIGAVSKGCEGKDISEMLDMRQAGAVAFSDGKRSIQHAGLLLRALQYVKIFDGLVIHYPNDKTISGNGQMHEGLTSTSLGLTGIPSMAEELMIQRDLQLLEYAESRLHLANISSAHSVELVRRAKKKGLAVTASVAVMNLAFDDLALRDFDSHFKVMPPLRAKTDLAALHKGLEDGTIDFISSNHVPIDSEGKNLEFPYAAFGAIGLETAYALSNTSMKKGLSHGALVEKWALNARKILGLPIPELVEGAVANLTIFNPEREWVVDEGALRSKSRNTPLMGMKLRGKVLGVVNNGKFKV